ncbi:MAG TPA: DUF1949 domain-containing protein [Ignavibacteria bacterium]|nr:DUF1949 domain-containing protein [Ignavibacteria bacterium]
MKKQEGILTIAGFTEEKLKEKGSRFIAQCFPITSEDEANNNLDEIRKKYYDATHHCYAYRLFDGTFKYSDDGEPSGTAGLRILNSIDHFSLTNILVVVIRYFGGTKLGVGPLGKAYYNSAFEVLQKAGKINKTFYNKIFVTVGFSQISFVHHVINIFDVKLKNTDYKDVVTFEILVKINEIDIFKDKLIDELKGGVQIIIEDEIILG